jgi:hypothetical protein
MSDHESFEDRLRAIADEVSRSMQRISEVDMEELSQRYGVDAERARSFADAAGQWLNDRLSGADPLFGNVKKPAEDSAKGPLGPDLDLEARAQAEQQTRPGSAAGPHPLDLPSDPQGVALSALDSGRWTVRPGNSQLAGTGTGAAPAPSDVVGELRARDWITADGTLTLVGRHALGRWCHTVGDPATPAPESEAPSA